MSAVFSNPPAAPGAPARRRGNLLIVDDEAAPREALKMIFHDDYCLLEAADGPTAVKLAQENRIDVAISDIRMAGMSGLEVLERLKYVDPRIEVILMTAFETADTMRQAMRLRAADYLTKPFDLESVRAAVRAAMQRRTLEGETHSNSEQLEQLREDLRQHEIEAQIARTQGEIYASIIHDINGPLAIISGFLQLVNQRVAQAEELSAADVEFLRDRLKTITRQATNCIDISRRYLGYLRRSGETASREPVNRLLADVKELLRTHPARQSHALEIEPLAPDMAVLMNGTELVQVLLNLVVNAFQASAQPGVVRVSGRIFEQPLDLLHLRDEPGSCALHLERFENVAPLVGLTVADNGPGIAAGLLPKIFEPYFSTKDPRQGAGLGLAIVQRLVKQARGVLRLHSAPGQGAAFTVYLRAAPLAGA